MISAVINQNTALLGSRNGADHWHLYCVVLFALHPWRENILPNMERDTLTMFHVHIFEYINIYGMCMCIVWGGWVCGVELLPIFRIIHVGPAHKSVWLRFTAVILRLKVRFFRCLPPCNNAMRCKRLWSNLCTVKWLALVLNLMPK